MSETISVAAAAREKNSVPSRHVRLLPYEDASVLAALVLPALAGLFSLRYLPGQEALFTVPGMYVAVPLNVVVFVVLFCAAFIAGSFVQSRMVYGPVRAIKTWLATARAAHFVPIPPAPNFGSGATGELGREVAAALALFSATSMNNDALTKQKSELLMMAAHQLHTPMTRVRWGVEQLLDPAMTPSAKDELCESIAGALRQMSLVVDNIVASSDIDTASAAYSFEPIELVPMIEKLLLEFKPTAELRHLEITFEHGDLPRVRGDKYRLSNVFYNLLSNGIDYTPAGGKVSISLEAKAQGVECRIADTGIGIPESDMAILFSKFHRGEHAKHMRPDGSGLGLYLVKNILTRHGSDVVVRSQDGAGTSVSFVLPLAQ